MKRLAPYLGPVLILLLYLLAFAPVATAQSKSVEVERRDGRMAIQQNGDVQVTETWEVNFIGGPFHFAFREIPLNRVNDITDWKVSENGQAYTEESSESSNTFSVTNSDNGRKITWYFPDTTEATRTFQLSYTLHGAVRVYPDGDQFWWKFIESGRQYTIKSSHVTVTLPGSFAADQLRATSYSGSAETGGAQVVDGQTVEFTGGPFATDTEWEVRTQFPHGAITASAPAWQITEDTRAARAPIYNLIFLGLSVLTLVAGLPGLYLLWYTRATRSPGRTGGTILQGPARRCTAWRSRHTAG